MLNEFAVTTKDEKERSYLLNQTMTSSKEMSYFSTQLTEMTNWKKSIELRTSNLVNLINNGQIKSKHSK